jgi:hypothetical protein
LAGIVKALFVLACVLLVAGCGSAATDTNIPSAAAKMVCAADAQREVSLSLGQALRQPVTPVWADRRYSCRYVYPVGTIVLSVSSAGAAATHAEPDGSLTVRKDDMVLRVDVHGLPATFGQPPLSRAEAARRVVADIMNCWTGD